MKHIVLTGFMGAGKTTLGKQLSAHYNIPFYDIDDEICLGERESIEGLISNSEHYFRTLEKAYVACALNKTESSIIALGGGAYCQSDTYKIIQQAKDVITIYIAMSNETCLKQLEYIKTSRPLLNQMDGEQWKVQALNLYQTRRPLYQRANLQVERETCTINVLIECIEKHYGKIY